MHFHSEIRVLVASSVLTNAATLLADPRYIKISYHFSFMIKTANERIPFKNYMTSEKSSLSHSLSFPLYISRTFSSGYYIEICLLCLTLSLFSLSISLSFHVSFYFNIYPLALSLAHLSYTLSNTLCLSFSLFLYFHI